MTKRFVGWLKPFARPWLLVCVSDNPRECLRILRLHKLDHGAGALCKVLPQGETPFRRSNAGERLRRRV